MSIEMSIIYRFIDPQQHGIVIGNVDFPANVDENVENISIFDSEQHVNVHGNVNVMERTNMNGNIKNISIYTTRRLSRD